MRWCFTIWGRLPGMNDYTTACRGNQYKGAQMKRNAQNIARACILDQLGHLRIERQVNLRYTFFEPNKRRDKDNIAGFAHKVIQDALVECKVLKDDGWDEIAGFEDKFDVDKKYPRIIVVIEEVEIERD